MVSLILLLGKYGWNNLNTDLLIHKEILEEKRVKGPINDNCMFLRLLDSFSSEKGEEDNILVQSTLRPQNLGL